jgi:hypothetical protein
MNKKPEIKTESIQQFLARGGQIKKCPTRKSPTRVHHPAALSEDMIQAVAQLRKELNIKS